MRNRSVNTNRAILLLVSFSRTSLVEHYNNTSSRLRTHTATVTGTKMKSKPLTLSLYLFFTCNICYAKLPSSINQGATDIRTNKFKQNEGTSSIETSVKSFRETNSIFNDILKEYEISCPDCSRINLKVIETRNKFPLVSTCYESVYVPLESIVS